MKRGTVAALAVLLLACAAWSQGMAQLGRVPTQAGIVPYYDPQDSTWRAIGYVYPWRTDSIQVEAGEWDTLAFWVKQDLLRIKTQANDSATVKWYVSGAPDTLPNRLWGEDGWFTVSDWTMPCRVETVFATIDYDSADVYIMHASMSDTFWTRVVMPD
jgi:hypothetical protein